MNGLVLGSFCPLHLGHCEMIDFASKQCDKLYVLICESCKTCDKKCDRKIPFTTRLWWLNKLRERYKNIEIRFTDAELPATSISNYEISKAWALHIKTILDFDIIFTSEKYGDYVAEILGIKHIPFDIDRYIMSISSTMIRENPFKYWNYLPEYVKPYYVKKVSIIGTESTGKTILTEKLSEYFNTNYVHEWARDIVNKTNDCTRQNILDIGYLHAKDINEKRQTSNKLLFSDTDLNTTKIYSKFLFNEEIVFDKWIEDTNKFDLYLFLDNDVHHVQDGTRLEKSERDKLQEHYLDYFDKHNIPIHVISGKNWDRRIQKSIKIIKDHFIFLYI